jgi:hypothetical protein
LAAAAAIAVRTVQRVAVHPDAPAVSAVVVTVNVAACAGAAVTSMASTNRATVRTLI